MKKKIIIDVVYTVIIAFIIYALLLTFNLIIDNCECRKIILELSLISIVTSIVTSVGYNFLIKRNNERNN